MLVQKFLRLIKCGRRNAGVEEFNEPRRFDSSSAVKTRYRDEADDDEEDLSCSAVTFKTDEDLGKNFKSSRRKKEEFRRKTKVRYIHHDQIILEKIPPLEDILIIDVEEFINDGFLEKQQQDSPHVSIHSGDSELIAEDENILGSDVELSYGSQMTHLSAVSHVSFLSHPTIISRKSSELTVTPYSSSEYPAQVDLKDKKSVQHYRSKSRNSISSYRIRN
jgi:hypothetical protein